MAAKRPIVNYNGKLKELADGDTLPDALKVALHDNLALKGYLNSANYDIVGGVISPKVMTETTKGLVPTPPNNTNDFLRADGTWATPTGGGGTATGEIWTSLTGTYASATTFTFPGTEKQAKLIIDSLFTCTNAAGTTRRYGYVSAASYAAGTITATVVCTDAALEATDIDFKVAYNQKARTYWWVISIPGTMDADTTESQGPDYQQIPWNYVILPPDFFVRTAATGSGALTIQLYKNTTALYTSAPDLATNTALLAQRLTTFTGSAGETLSLRIMSSSGTLKATYFQARIPVIPIDLFTAF